MVKPGYKQTEIGVIPEEWGISTLGAVSVGNLTYGINAPAKKYMPPLPNYIRITDITEDGHFNKENRASVDCINPDKYLLHEGDVVLARTGASVGKSYLYDTNDGLLVYAGFLIRASIDANLANSYYVVSSLRTKRYWDWVGLTSMRSGQPGINGKEYASYPLMIPSLVEQNKIAEALQDVDKQIDILEKLIAKKKTIKQGTMQELLTGKKRLPGFGGEWIECTLPDVLQPQSGIKIGPFGSQLKKEYLSEMGPYHVYGQENVYKSDFSIGSRYISKLRFSKLQSCEICAGDFLISTMGTIGKCAIAPENIHRGIMDSHLIRLRIDETKIKSEYLLQLFSDSLGYLKHQTTQLSVGGIMDGLSTKIVNALTITFPKDLLEQQAIISILKAMDNEIGILEQKLAKARQLKQGMMQQLLTGKIRLV